MNRQPEHAFRIQGLELRYPEFVLGPLDLDLEPGAVLALIGPNGAGKTSLLDCLVGLTAPGAGRIEVGGRDALMNPDWKSGLGFVGDVHVFFEDWDGHANLAFLARFRAGGTPARATELARRFDLDLGRKVRRLSRGNRCKLALVAALVHQPRLLVLDEPTAGLDPVVRGEFLDCLRELREDETRAIVYSTHILSDVERLADELAFLDGGKLLLRASVTELQDDWARLYFQHPVAPLELPGVIESKREGDSCMVVTARADDTCARLGELGARELMRSGLELEEIAVRILKRARQAKGGRA